MGTDIEMKIACGRPDFSIRYLGALAGRRLVISYSGYDQQARGSDGTMNSISGRTCTSIVTKEF